MSILVQQPEGPEFDDDYREMEEARKKRKEVGEQDDGPDDEEVPTRWAWRPVCTELTALSAERASYASPTCLSTPNRESRARVGAESELK